MYEEAAKYGLKYGIIFPIFGPDGEFGVFSFSSTSIDEDDYEEVFETFLPQLSVLKDFAFEPARRHAKSESKNIQLTLTSREKEVLGWTIEGKSCWEISIILGCSEATIHYHMNKLRRKLNARSKQQIMVKAITLGLIHA
jgi:LuxR family quorum-sensing transcriptional regulator LasR